MISPTTNNQQPRTSTKSTTKGFQDFTGEQAIKRNQIKKIIQQQFELYGFEPAETPIIESISNIPQLTKNQKPKTKNIDEVDSAVRDVFRLQDRGKRDLALRYEFTFQLKRIAQNQKLPYKRFQIGEVFRDERIKKGRTRQFTQCDVDVVGSSIKDEAELIKLTSNIFQKLNIPIKIFINNRKLINEILVEQNIPEKNREQVIREIDKLDKLDKKEIADNLKKINAEKILKIFDQKESEFTKYNFYSEIKELKKYCKIYEVKVEFKPTLARGLSYYNGSIFEVWSDELEVSLAGGGSYLTNEIQSTGISLGFEPISLISKIEGDKTNYQIISIDQDETAINLAEKLRVKGKSVNLILDKTISKAMEYANSKEIQNVIFVGKEEVESKKFKVKNMQTGEEEILK